MSTISRPAPTAHPMKLVPELENGDRLTRAEFERRYDAMPDLKKAKNELKKRIVKKEKKGK